VYQPGEEPSAAEIAGRVERYWRPYHEALAGELDRLRSRHGRVLLWEGHSIRSRVPFLFEGTLPDLNVGTAAGASCSAERLARVEARLAAQSRYSWVVNGRFKGGYITRHYGRPDEGVDAIQLEIAQCTYMDEASGRYDPALAGQLQSLLMDLLEDAGA
jgi:N-formylglutamate deformylase